ncbi:MAG: hypothetical protein WEB89_10585, partial [Balneolales bacterium]
MKTFLVLSMYLGCVFAFSSQLPADKHSSQDLGPPPTVNDILSVREKFTYEVRYGFFNLGTITIETLKDTTYLGQPAHYLFIKIKSNQGIPLVGYKERNYHAIMAHNDTTFYGMKFWTDSVHDNIFEETLYDYDYPAQKLYTFEEGEAVDTLELLTLADSGPSFFYFSRLHAGTDRKVNYPIYINHEKGNVELENYSQIENYSSEAFPDGDVKAVRTRGNADVNGPFGFSGSIDAIFMADDLRIPLEARVRVWVGNVRVRLIDYEVKNN